MQNLNLPPDAAANTISLMIGHPDPTTLFTPEFQASVNRVLAAPQPFHALEYGQEQGNPALIDFLVDKFNRDQTLALSREQLMIVAGSTHAVDMIARLYTHPGGAVMVEAPTYADALHIFRDHSVELHGVPMDDQGVIIAEMERLLERLSASGNLPALFYTIPTFHNPSGTTLSESRRVEILKLAQRYGFMIVEDDVYRALEFDTHAPPSFFALAKNSGVSVTHIGSFSKTLAPGLRLGWLIASAEAIAGFVDCGTTQMGGGASPLSAQIVAEYCRQGHWEAHILHLQQVYQMRRDIMLAALEQYMPEGVTWTMPAGGFFVWVTLPENVFAREVKRQAQEHRVMVAAGPNYFIDPNSDNGQHNLRLTYSFAPPEDIETAVRILAEVVTGLCA
ncbi:MAG: PLP-dependent aminotransferase family protein [Burkholderiales bacterium]|nr:PLP-dependent aminotransferase family protein [Anaerolineae bacterium]